MATDIIARGIAAGVVSQVSADRQAVSEDRDAVEAAKTEVLNVAESIPEDYSTLSADVSELKEDLMAIIGLNPITLANSDFNHFIGGIESSTGEPNTSVSRYFYTDYIDVSNYKSIDVSMEIVTQSSSMSLAFYDVNKTFIAPAIRPNIKSEEGTEIRTIAVPENAKFMRTSYKVEHWNTFSVTSSASTINTVLNDINEDILSMEKNLSEVIENSLNLNDDFSKVTTFEMGGLSGGGIPVDATNRIRSNYILLTGMNRIEMNIDDGYQAQFCTFTKDKERVVIGGNTWVWRNKVTLDKTEAFDYFILVLRKTDDSEISIQDANHAHVKLLNNLNENISAINNTIETLTEYKNMFDASLAKQEYRLTQLGEDYQESDFYISNYIEVESGETYTKNSPTEDAYHRTCFYNGNKEFITNSTTENSTFTTDNNTAYIRFCGKISELANTVLCKGESADEYTAIDRVARRNNPYRIEKPLDLSWEMGTFNNSLFPIASSKRIRTQIITGVRGYLFTASVNDGFKLIAGGEYIDNLAYHGRKVIKPVGDSVRFAIAYDDDRDMTLEDLSNVGLKIHCYKIRPKTSEYDVVVAANNSSVEDKMMADFVCDGVNDEEEIEYAINYNLYKRPSCNVLLLPGTYNIDKFSTRKLDNNLNTSAQYALMCGDYSTSSAVKCRYNVSISGRYRSEHRLDDSDTIINVTDTALGTLSTSVDNVLIGSPRIGDNKLGIKFDLYTLSVRNLMIYTNGVENKIIAIDGAGSGQFNVENCDIWSVQTTANVTFDTIEIPDGSIGIRGNYGSCRGVKQSLKGNRIVGYKEGIALLGEHFIVEDNLQHHCYYGFTVGNYDVREAMEHPNIFIGNSVEQCYRMGLLNRYGATEESTAGWAAQTLIYIGGSTETTWRDSDGNAVSMLPIKEVVKGTYRGRIETDRLSKDTESGRVPLMNVFEDDGSGVNMKQTVY